MSDSTTIQLKKLLALLPDILQETEYSELYGYDLKSLPDTPAGTVIRDRLLTKFLVGNKFVVNDAAAQLKKTLAWRRDFNPLAAAFSEPHNHEFEKLAIVTSVAIPKAKIEPTKSASSSSAAAASKTAKTSDAAADEDAAKDTKTDEAAAAAATEAKAPAEPASVVESTEPSAEPAKAAEVTEPVAEPVAEPVTEPAPEAVEATEATEVAEVAEPIDKAITSDAEAEVAPVSTETEPKPQLIMNWNLYGAVKNRQKLFSDLDGFIRWRVGLMERAISLLDFSSIETSYIAQLHDYNNVSFLFLDSPTKAASKATIELFQNYYPEFLNVKYFVNIPIVMSWLYSFVKLLVSKETFDKFRVVANGADLARTAGNWVPKQYGGQAESLDEIAVKEFVPTNAALVDAPRPEKKVAPEPAPKAEAEEASATAAEEPTTTTTAAPAETTEAPTDTTAAKVAEPKTVEPATESAEVVEPKTSELVEPKTVEPAEPKTAEPALEAVAVPKTAEPEIVSPVPIVTPVAEPAVVTTEPVEPTATPVADAVEATTKPTTAV